MDESVGRLIQDLTGLSPDLAAALSEHIELNGEILSHVFFGDVTRYVVALHADASPAAAPELSAILALLEDRFGHGTEAEDNLIAASFLDNLPNPTESGAALRYKLGPSLTRQLRVIWPTDTRPPSN